MKSHLSKTSLISILKDELRSTGKAKHGSAKSILWHSINTYSMAQERMKWCSACNNTRNYLTEHCLQESEMFNRKHIIFYILNCMTRSPDTI